MSFRVRVRRFPKAIEPSGKDLGVGSRHASIRPIATGKELASFGEQKPKSSDDFSNVKSRKYGVVEATSVRSAPKAARNKQLPLKKDRSQGSRAWWASFQRQELPYGSANFLAASELARNLPNPPRVSALSMRIVRKPTLIRVLMAILRLPLVELHVRRPDVDAWGTAYFNPARSGRLAQAVLELPTVQEQYLRGRPKQALRTNLRRAREIGITSARVPAYEVWFEAMSAILRARHDAEPADWEQYKPAPGQRVAYYVARDAEETPLACARVALFGAFGVLFWMISRPDLHPVASWARYQLHTCLVLDLGRSGNKHLLVGSALKEAVGTQYFQHLLGYRARNLRVRVIDTDLT